MDSIALNEVPIDMKGHIRNVDDDTGKIVNKINIVEYLLDNFEYLFENKIVGDPYYNGALDFGNAVIDYLKYKGRIHDIAGVLDTTPEIMDSKILEENGLITCQENRI